MSPQMVGFTWPILELTDTVDFPAGVYYKSLDDDSGLSTPQLLNPFCILSFDFGRRNKYAYGSRRRWGIAASLHRMGQSITRQGVCSALPGWWS